MSADLMICLCAAAVVGSGLVAGVFLSFSDFVMKALASAQTASGIEAMQLINRRVYGSVFLSLLMGAGALCLGLMIGAVLLPLGAAGKWIMAGGLSYLLGVLLVTMICNVPMNKRLDRMSARAGASATFWAWYANRWTQWNHLRSAAAAGSTVCFLLACLLLEPAGLTG